MIRAVSDTRPSSNLPCVILAGGRSRRFGSDKAVAELGGQRLIDIVLHKLRAQTDGPIAVNAAGDAYAGLGVPLIADRLGGTLGPLAGLHAALCWAAEQGHGDVVTTPVDTPLLPADFIARLAAHGAPAVAFCNGRTHAVHGIWPTRLKDDLRSAVEAGMRAAQDWQTACGAGLCRFPHAADDDPFANINRPEDLAALQRS